MKFDSIATTNKLLLFLVIPLAFYVLKVLKFIFIPLMFAIFIALLFMPLMRWLYKRKTPKFIALIIVLAIITATLFVAINLVKLSSREIMVGKTELFQKLDTKIGTSIAPYLEIIGIDPTIEHSAIQSILQNDQINATLYKNFGSTFSFLEGSISMVLMTLFFLILLLAGSINFRLFMQTTLYIQKTQSVKTFMAIERSIVKFLKVKFFVSLLTGVTFGLICLFFGISFPLFWGIFTFVIHFVQLVGSIIATVLITILAFIEINNPGTVVALFILLAAVQIIYGSVLEPILMGQSFKINVIAVLVMLMFWGFLWGIPGLILSIPLTVLLKTILDQFPKTQFVSKLMA